MVAAVDRATRVLAAINEVAGAEGVPVAIHHVCIACAAAVQASGVGLYLRGELGLCEPLYVTNPVSEHIAELQVMLGEGPGTEALREDHPVLVSTVGSDSSVLRWPAFAPAAVAAGVLAVFAFPLVMGAISVGVLEIHRGREGGLSATELAEALLFADAALPRVLDHLSGPGIIEGADLPNSGFEYRWAEVHQATGMVSVQLDSDLTAAFLRLRAHAYLTGRRLSQVASDVVDRRLRFDPDTDNAGGTGSGG
ncbi:MAG TPA: GAF and ANTAR domain-containing protein [Pseudonocardiaceae bacterium]|nr:GAF and ANTAR domain-containing protein [Pseudonocardiaceae bacterium]